LAAIVVSLVAAILVAGIGWLTVGNRFDLDEDEGQNDILNLGAYAGIVFLLGVIVSFGVTLY
jgi:hypothetical protein